MFYYSWSSLVLNEYGTCKKNNVFWYFNSTYNSSATQATLYEVNHDSRQVHAEIMHVSAPGDHAQVSRDNTLFKLRWHCRLNAVLGSLVARITHTYLCCLNYLMSRISDTETMPSYAIGKHCACSLNFIHRWAYGSLDCQFVATWSREYCGPSLLAYRVYLRGYRQDPFWTNANWYAGLEIGPNRERERLWCKSKNLTLFHVRLVYILSFMAGIPIRQLAPSTKQSLSMPRFKPRIQHVLKINRQIRYPLNDHGNVFV